MNAVCRARSAGFTITELLIAVAVLGVLMMLAVPNFRELLRNSEVRGAAEALAAGLSRARAEAVSQTASA